MTRIKTPTSGSRGEPLRNQVIDAAERLLREGKAGFSMRDLAAEAGVSFATPFNQFGSKAAIMHALSARRIDTMTQRFAAAPVLATAAARVLLATDIATEVMLADPGVNRAVMAWIGSVGSIPGRVFVQSTALWTLALGAGDGLAEARRDEALTSLPGQFAIAFRGVLSFWTSGELSDEMLALNARAIAKRLLLSFSEALPSQASGL